MIIDFHTHCYTDVLAQKAMSRLPKGKLTPCFDGTLSGLNGMMDKAGIDLAVVLNIANRPDTMTKVNDWAISLLRHKNIIPFGSVHPNADYVTELKRLRDNGIKGLKVHPHYQQFFVNDRAALKMYEQMLKHGFIVLFHCGKDMISEVEYCTPRIFADVIKAFEGEKIVAAHLGGGGYFHDCVEYVFGRDVYIDTSVAYVRTNQSQKNQLFSAHSMDKILFGSDMPWLDPVEALQALRDTAPTPQALQKITHENAKKLLF